MTSIIKASGEIAQFDKAKLKRSLERVGADENLIDQIVKNVEKSLISGMKTHEIYRIAFKILKKKSKPLAAKFHLKRAILKLGVSGFPFEHYFSELLRAQNMKVITNTFISGRCVNHEVDILATDKNETIFVECKYHNTQGIKTDVKICLYVKARFDDLREKSKASAKSAGWLVTNTRFSSDAIKYGVCAGVHLIGWDFPKKGSLKDLIESLGLYPVTCITNFNKSEIAQLLSDKIVLCKNIMEQPEILDNMALSDNRKQSILAQCNNLCSRARSNQ